MAPRKILPLLSVALVYAAVQAPLIRSRVCPSRDGARYMTQALRLEREPWKEVFRTSVDHPGYPLFLFLVFSGGKKLGLSSPAEEILLAEASTACVGLLFVAVAFTVLRRLWGLLPAWGGMLSFVLLPRPGWVSSDVLSDPLHALFWMSSAAFILRGIELESPWRFFAAGLLGALAYWVRVDALTLLCAVAVTGLFFLFKKARDGSWPRWRAGLALALFAASFCAGLAAFVVVTGKLSTKPVSELFVLRFSPPGAAGPLLLGLVTFQGPLGILTALGHLISRAAQEVQVVHLVLAGMTAAGALRVFRLRPAGAFLLSVHLTYLVVLVLLDLRAGYLSGRYFFPLVPFWTGFGMYGLASLFEQYRRGSRLGWISLGIVLSLAASLPSLLKGRDHASSQGTLEAGQWLKGQMVAGDTLYDPYFYPSFLAGLRDRALPDPLPKSEGHDHYVIIDERELSRKKDVEKLVDEKRLEEVEGFQRAEENGRKPVHVYRARREPAPRQ